MSSYRELEKGEIECICREWRQFAVFWIRCTDSQESSLLGQDSRWVKPECYLYVHALTTKLNTLSADLRLNNMSVSNWLMMVSQLSSDIKTNCLKGQFISCSYSIFTYPFLYFLPIHGVFFSWFTLVTKISRWIRLWSVKPLWNLGTGLSWNCKCKLPGPLFYLTP